ncbi:MAG: hypothetical protein J1D86_03085 [Alistipes sp.]|nr:hypothetical protein [Alistipes sp.]
MPAILAFVWGLIYKDGYSDWIAIVVLLLATIYFICDVLQYFIGVVKYKKHIEVINNLVNKNVPEKDIAIGESAGRKRINDLSFRIFIVKSAILAIVFLFFIIMVGRALFQSNSKKDISEVEYVVPTSSEAFVSADSLHNSPQ